MVAEGLRDAAVGVGAMAWAGLNPAPPSPYNQSIGPHRRFTWVRVNLADIKAIKNELGGTVNDVVLATVAGALGKHLRRRGQNTDGLELKAMVPVSVRADVERGALGNRVAAMMAPLPVWCQDPVARLDIVREELKGLKSGGQAVGAQVLTAAVGLRADDGDGPGVARRWRASASSTSSSRTCRDRRSRSTWPGKRMIDTFPMVPLAKNQALGIALLSYAGRINFGLVGDYDLMWDLDEFADDVRESLAELAAEAGVELTAEEAPSGQAVRA